MYLFLSSKFEVFKKKKNIKLRLHNGGGGESHHLCIMENRL